MPSDRPYSASGATSRTTLWPGSEIYILFDLAHDLVRLCCLCQNARIEFDICSAELPFRGMWLTCQGCRQTRDVNHVMKFNTDYYRLPWSNYYVSQAQMMRYPSLAIIAPPVRRDESAFSMISAQEWSAVNIFNERDDSESEGRKSNVPASLRLPPRTQRDPTYICGLPINCSRDS